MHIGGRPRFEFHLLKSNEVPRGSYFCERNITHKIFCNFRTIFGRWRQSKLRIEVRFHFVLLTNFQVNLRLTVLLDLHVYERKSNFWKHRRDQIQEFWTLTRIHSCKIGKNNNEYWMWLMYLREKFYSFQMCAGGITALSACFQILQMFKKLQEWNNNSFA